MNNYLNISRTQVNEIPLYTVVIYYILIPMTAGSLIDILINKIAGPQHCSFDDGDKICKLYGTKLQAWQREIMRSLLQIAVAFGLIVSLQTYIDTNKSLYLNLAIVFFVASQTNLFDDFRRFLSNLMFTLNYKN